MIVYRLYNAQTHTTVAEHNDQGDAQQHRCILEDAMQKPIYICEHRTQVEHHE